MSPNAEPYISSGGSGFNLIYVTTHKKPCIWLRLHWSFKKRDGCPSYLDHADMFNIVIFDPAQTAGGSFSRAVELAAELPEFNYIFLTYKPFAELHSGNCPPHYKAVRLFSFFNAEQAHWLQRTIKQKLTNKALLKCFFLLLRALRKANKTSLQIQSAVFLAWRKIDLVQSNTGIHFLPYYLSIIKKAKLIYYFRDLQYFAHLPPHFLQQGEELIFVGQKLMEQYQAQLNLPENKCQKIHSPFDVHARMKFEKNQNMELLKHLKESGKKILVCSGRICEEKGQHIIIEAIKQLVTSWPELTLLIVGEAAKNHVGQAYLKNLKQITTEYRLNGNVIFLGHRKDPLHVLQYADIAVQAPTYFEALAGSLVESVQLGIPTVSSDIGGAREVLIEGETGFLFPPEDYNALAKIIDRILRNPAETTQIIEQGKAHALRIWSPIKISSQMRAIYSNARNTR